MRWPAGTLDFAHGCCPDFSGKIAKSEYVLRTFEKTQKHPTVHRTRLRSVRPRPEVSTPGEFVVVTDQQAIGYPKEEKTGHAKSTLPYDKVHFEKYDKKM